MRLSEIERLKEAAAMYGQGDAYENAMVTYTEYRILPERQAQKSMLPIAVFEFQRASLLNTAVTA